MNETNVFYLVICQIQIMQINQNDWLIDAVVVYENKRIINSVSNKNYVE